MTTRADLDALAAALRDSRPNPEPYNGTRSLDYWAWRRAAVAVAGALDLRCGLDRNGNRRFRPERFYTAAGIEPPLYGQVHAISAFDFHDARPYDPLLRASRCTACGSPTKAAAL